jgi:hypothetical protein
MYLILAYRFVAFTTATVLWLLRLGWVNRRYQARREDAGRAGPTTERDRQRRIRREGPGILALAGPAPSCNRAPACD